MSSESTVKMIQAYFQDAAPVRFFSGLFRSARENFFNSKEVEIDIVRGEEDVAVAVHDLSAGYRSNEATSYVNKSFVPPIFKESVALDSNQLMDRLPSNTPFDDPSFKASIMSHFFRGMRKIEDKISRAIELQASQVMQTGAATLVDYGGNSVYTIDYQPKASHFPTAGTAWSGAADIKADLKALCNVIRNDGLSDPNVSYWGEDAYDAALANTAFKDAFEVRRIDTGSIMPMAMGGTSGANFRGTIDLGNFKLEIWTYGARYKHPQTGVVTQYLDPAKVIVMDSSARFDALYGGVPHIGRELGMSGQSILGGMPRRFSSTEKGRDLFTNVWLTDDKEQLFGGVASRPLMVPTAIDRYGCISTGV